MSPVAPSVGQARAHAECLEQEQVLYRVLSRQPSPPLNYRQTEPSDGTEILFHRDATRIDKQTHRPDPTRPDADDRSTKGFDGVELVIARPNCMSAALTNQRANASDRKILQHLPCR